MRYREKSSAGISERTVARYHTTRTEQSRRTIGNGDDLIYYRRLMLGCHLLVPASAYLGVRLYFPLFGFLATCAYKFDRTHIQTNTISYTYCVCSPSSRRAARAMLAHTHTHRRATAYSRQFERANIYVACMYNAIKSKNKIETCH